MKVLFVLPNVRVGGVERVRLTLIEHLVANGVECRLALRRCQGELMDHARALAPVDELAPRGVYQFVPSLANLIRREQPTHVVTAFSDVAVLSWIAMRRANSNARWIHSVHNTHSMVGSRIGRWGRMRYRIENRMGIFAYHRADSVIVVSNGVRQELVDWYGIDPCRIATIYNPVVPDARLGREHPPESIPGNPYRIAAIGRLVRQKGFDILIRAMHGVPDHWRLDIWGEGREHDALEAAISAAGMRERVRLRGYTADPYLVLRDADLFVLPSRHEGLPASLIEALASECQIVATDCPHGPREILEDGQLGQLVPVEDPSALANAIIRAMHGDFSVPRTRLLERAADFSRSRCCLRWEALLREQ